MSSPTTEAGRASRASYMRKWRAKNPERSKSIQAAYMVRVEQSHEKRAAFRELCNARNRKYAKAHPEVIRANSSGRYTPERGKILRARFDPLYASKNIIRAAKCRAKKTGIAFDLTVEWYESEMLNGCAVTGIALEKVGAKGPWVAHIDRKVASAGYVMSNCRLVCAVFNLARKNWSDADVLRMARALVARNADE